MSETIARGTAGYWRASLALFLAAFSVFAAIYESDFGYANLKIMASIQEDDISVIVSYVD